MDVGRSAGAEGAPHARGAGVERLGGDPPSPWEGQYSFSRMVLAGGFVLVAGMTSVDADGVVLGRTPYEQMIEVLRKLSSELGRVGAALTDVVQSRVYVTDIERADEVGRAHQDAFGDTRPVMTMVEVSRLIDPRMLVELEAVAWLSR